MERRKFLKLMGIVSGAAAASGSWSLAHEKVVSHLLPPPDGAAPGEPHRYLTTCTECPAGCGLMVTVRDGYPVKLEGNPAHPVNRGALCLRGQASLMRLYHPERIHQPLRRNPAGKFVPVSWDEALAAVKAGLEASTARGKRSAYLAGLTTGSLAAAIDSFCRETGVERLPEFEFYHHGALRSAYQALFGQLAVPAFQLGKADVLLSLGADLGATFLSPVEHARELAEGLAAGMVWMHAEPGLSLAGLRAGMRLPIRPGGEASLLAYLLHELPARQPLPAEVAGAVPRPTQAEVASRSGLSPEAVDKVVQALKTARRPMVLAGGPATAQPGGLGVAMLAGLLQWTLGAVNDSVDFTAAANFDRLGTQADLARLGQRLQAKEIGVLFLSRLHSPTGQPDFPPAIAAAELAVGLTDFLSPPYQRCQIILPLPHALESWGDAEPRRGLLGLIRPVFRPFHDTRPEVEILSALTGRETTGKALHFDRWRPLPGSWWRDAFHQSHPAGGTVTLRPADAAAALQAAPPPADAAAPWTVVAPSLRTYDGRSRPIPLLHEIPDPLSTVSYGPYVSVAAATAQQQGLAAHEVFRTDSAAGRLELPLHLQAGLPPGVWQLPVDALGDLRLPVDALTGEAAAVLPGLGWERTGLRHKLPVLSGSTDATGRGITPGGTKDAHHHAESHTLLPPQEHKPYRWAMAIDLDRCNGCSACVAACYLENNIPITGPSEHLHGRELSWLRIQPYFNRDEPPVILPMMCQQCGYAPCETVCPVYATYHNEEGLNVQVYNRCVGTRYCNNNCPYKARRFNWFDYDRPAPLNLLYNPEVSRRPKGVMEKCTFCIQRIRAAKDAAKDQGRLVRDGEITTACAQTCPSGAITFGNLLAPGSRVSILARSERAYRVLEAIGTEPAVYYLSKRVK